MNISNGFKDAAAWIKNRTTEGALDKTMVIQGLLAERNNEQRVYVVTVSTPPEYAWIHDRWPKLVRLPG